MKIGITGHQRRAGLNWSWTTSTIRSELAKRADAAIGLSSLAAGADQVFAQQALDLGMVVWAVLPFEGYERCFAGADLSAYQRTLARCRVTQLHGAAMTDAAYYAAGKYIVDEADLLFAVWDGKQSAGLGGTGDVVAYAKQTGRKILHLDPFDCVIREI
jgi:hypothetical protein